MQRGAKFLRKKGQAKLHDLKWKGKVGLVGLSALQARGSEKLAEGKGCWRKKRRGFFSQGAKGDGSASSPFCPLLTPATPLCVQGAPLEPRWREKRWQNKEKKKRKKAKPPNPMPTEGIGFWAAISSIGLWMNEKRLLALVFAWLVGPRKSW